MTKFNWKTDIVLELESNSKKASVYQVPTTFNSDSLDEIKKVQEELDAKINNVYESFQEKYVDFIE